MEKACLNCRHYKNGRCFSKDFNRIIKADVPSELIEAFDFDVDAEIDICEPDEFYCCFWE